MGHLQAWDTDGWNQNCSKDEGETDNDTEIAS